MKTTKEIRDEIRRDSFGTCMHGVAERFLRADALGRGPDGRPVELYPPGWDAVALVEKKRGGFVKTEEVCLCDVAEEDADFALENMKAELTMDDDDVNWVRLEDYRKIEVW